MEGRRARAAGERTRPPMPRAQRGHFPSPKLWEHCLAHNQSQSPHPRKYVFGLQEYVQGYLHKLEADGSGRFQHIIWPEHCLVRASFACGCDGQTERSPDLRQSSTPMPMPDSKPYPVIKFTYTDWVPRPLCRGSSARRCVLKRAPFLFVCMHRSIDRTNRPTTPQRRCRLHTLASSQRSTHGRRTRTSPCDMCGRARTRSPRCIVPFAPKCRCLGTPPRVREGRRKTRSMGGG